MNGGYVGSDPRLLSDTMMNTDPLEEKKIIQQDKKNRQSTFPYLVC